ncbi:outer membrane beta-barrel protein [Coraliomargarita sp. SDUM461003]|uniref:Outer membrane beta-barrel protein n=1 Tax=Thalassobacterium maritimum TaxID=3041265 RepID=A0ABU1AY95_9BACT|nr:outer membrane beta-barrel protein [Coraliomargarita sp. SDUM461003]MDQ8208209.1 outer membrane beta-barrel protein [Coraliomargarita sp. SDUM461003]
MFNSDDIMNVGSKNSLYVLLMLSGAYLNAEVSLGDSGALALGLDTKVESTSNATLSSAETSDTIFSALPSVKFRSDAGAVSIDAFVGVELLRYDRLDNNDSENFKSGVTVVFPDEMAGENYSLVLNAGFNQNTSATSALQQVTETEDLSLSALGTYYISEYVSLRSGVTYLNSESKTAGFADLETYEVPFAVYYKYDETLNLGLGYRYRNTEVSEVTPAANSDDHAVFFAIEDLLSPLVQYEINVGYQYREFDSQSNFDDEGAAFAQAMLTWFIADRSRLLASIGNDYGTSAANQSSETFFTELTLQHEYDERLSAAIGMRYEEVDYEQAVGSRSDDELAFYVSGDYQLVEDRWLLRGRLSYADHSSDAVTAQYDVIHASIACILVF